MKKLAEKLEEMSIVEEPIPKPEVEETPAPEMSFHCLFLTKLYYKSPFIDICRDKHLVKLYKANRGGSF
jgi:hypothetical protein